MGRHRQSKEFAGIEAIASLLGLCLMVSFLSPDFRRLLPVFIEVFILLTIVVVGLRLWFKSRQPHPPASTYETVDREPLSSEGKNFSPVSQPLPTSAISEKLRKMDWYQFEKLMQLVYQRQGYKVKRVGGANPDGGVDLLIELANEQFVVQCKHWRKWTVGVRNIREFLGTLADTKISKGVYVTMTGYTDEARILAGKHGIQLLQESDIIRMLREVGSFYAKEINELFADHRKMCPKCEREMVLRTSRLKGNKFWGCSGFPRCRFILNCQG